MPNFNYPQKTEYTSDSPFVFTSTKDKTYFIENILKEEESMDEIRTVTYSKPVNVFTLEKIFNISLKKTLYLTGRYENKTYFVANEELNLWGDGDSFEEAKIKFEKYFLFEHKKLKKNSPKRLSLCAKELLQRFEAYI